MELEEAIANLEEYIKLDEKYIDYDDSDFAKFCKNHCEDIQKVLHYIKEESIPRAVVEEKIEELKEKSGGNVFHIQQTINSNIRLLQEILTKGEK